MMKEQVEQQIRQILTMTISAQAFSNALFGYGGLFGKLAQTEQERRVVAQSALFREAQSRFDELSQVEADAAPGRDRTDTWSKSQQGGGHYQTRFATGSPGDSYRWPRDFVSFHRRRLASVTSNTYPKNPPSSDMHPAGSSTSPGRAPHLHSAGTPQERCAS